jgi:hypothetical protein
VLEHLGHEPLDGLRGLGRAADRVRPLPASLEVLGVVLEELAEGRWPFALNLCLAGFGLQLLEQVGLSLTRGFLAVAERRAPVAW